MFFDESFHDSLKEPGVSLGALCGVGIPEDQVSQVEADVYVSRITFRPLTRSEGQSRFHEGTARLSRA